MQKRLFVAGGNGFIGREISRTALGAGHEVTVLTRSGRPRVAEPWAEHVTWVQGDALEPDSWREELSRCDAAIHSIGMVQEEPLGGRTYERVNAETAIVLAREANEAGLDSFVMISAKHALPLVPERYLTTKRNAEEHIQEQYPELRSVFLRPALVYGPGRPSSIIAGRAYQAINALPRALQQSETHPLYVEHVAATAVYAATEPDIRGVISEREIYDIAETTAGTLRVPPASDKKLTLLAAAGAVGALAAGYFFRKRK